MFKKFLERFRRIKENKITPEQVMHPDEFYREVVAQAFNSRKPVIGNRKEDGTWEIKEI